MTPELQLAIAKLIEACTVGVSIAIVMAIIVFVFVFWFVD